MRDDHRDGAARVVGGHAREPLVHASLGLDVQRVGGLVQHQHQRLLAHHRAGQRHLLPLPAREVDPVQERPAERRLEAFGQLGLQVEHVCPPEGGAHLAGVLDVRDAPQADALAREHLEPHELLKRAGEPPAPRRRVELGEIRAVHRDPPVRGSVETAEERYQRALARAVLAHDRDHRPRGEGERDVVDGVSAGAGVAKRDVLQRDPARDVIAPCDVLRSPCWSAYRTIHA